jgi:hypothetical protein
MPSGKSDVGRYRTHAEVEHMVERIRTILNDIPEEKGYRTILNGFITDLVSYPEVRQVYDETRDWIMHKPELLEDYLLGMQSLTQFVADVRRDGIEFFCNDVYNENCAIAQKIAEKYHIFKGSKSIYWLAFLVNNGIARKEGNIYIVDEALRENDFTY